uniref:Uncharacterized protein n=1 Tax=Lepeophtheirus salmonis TaxID=72036 RepID=A0A0K2SZE2_LEPSM
MVTTFILISIRVFSYHFTFFKQQLYIISYVNIIFIIVIFFWFIYQRNFIKGTFSLIQNRGVI